MEHGIVRDWDDMERIWQYIYSKDQLQTFSEEVYIKESETQICKRHDPEVIKLFSCSTQLSMKFKLLINVEIVKISGKFRFKSQKLVIYPADKC